MHDTAMEAGKIFFETYAYQNQLRILDVGSQDVNGSLRSVAPKNAQYIGADMVQGRGVDVLLENPYTFPFDVDEFDLIVSSSCFEHTDMFWVTFLEMVRVTKPGGYIYINAPSNGKFHRYPRDNWRFYPDCGRALEMWAQRQNSPVLLMECLTLRRKNDTWNDCVLVFRKEPSARQPPAKLMCDHFTNAQNITRVGSDEIFNFSESTEDMELVGFVGELGRVLTDALDARIGALVSKVDNLRMEQSRIGLELTERFETSVRALGQGVANISSALDQDRIFLQSLRSELAEAGSENDRLRSEVNTLLCFRSWRITALMRNVLSAFKRSA
jgi:SAM-dependent methyltransferase